LDHHTRERLVARVLSGRERLVLPDGGRDRVFWLRPPTPLDRHLAAEVHAEAARDAELHGLPGDDDVLALLRRSGLWTDKDDRDLATATENVETLKVALYRAAFRRRDRDAAREMLARTRALVAELRARRHQFDFKTASGAAAVARGRFLVGRCLLRPDGAPVWPDDDFWRDDSPLLDEALREHTRTRLSEPELRELARTEPWRSVWACRHSEGRVFGAPAAELTDEQRLLSVWSRLYDNAYEDPDCPPDEVVSDDDMFDGWMALRRREREKDTRKKRGEGLVGSDKVASMGEVFVVGARPQEAAAGHSPEDLAAIEELNDPEAAAVKAERMAALRRAGALHEHHMPDSRRDIAAQFAAGMRERARAK
jgi:hypothetical protein